jgi:hydrogenase nickel incorporation protein HypA/HybF
MHEVSIAQSILAIADDYARRNGASSITTVGLRIGELSGVVAEALETAFDIAKLGTLAEHARLEIESVPLIAFCQHCQQEFEVSNPYAIAHCPACAAISRDVRQGQELDVSYLEVN